MTVAERLDERLLTERPPDAPTEPDEAWRVRDLDDAAYASRQAAAAAREIADAEAWRQREIDAINRAADAEVARHQNKLAYFTNVAAVYLDELVRAGRKTKTLDLPGGKISLRARPPKIEADDDAVLAWARAERPDLVRVTEALDKGAWKKAVVTADDGAVIDRATGEVLPFARWHDAGQSATFTPRATKPQDEPDEEEE